MDDDLFDDMTEDEMLARDITPTTIFLGLVAAVLYAVAAVPFLPWIVAWKIKRHFEPKQRGRGTVRPARPLNVD